VPPAAIKLNGMVRRVADAVDQFHMLTQPFQVSTMLG
jgi:hypothetical protein